MITARRAALWLLCLLGGAVAGCAWAETMRDYPRSAFPERAAPGHVHHRGPAPGY